MRVPLPRGVFYPAVLVGDLAYVSGQVPRNTVWTDSMPK
jgi:enamine deaminase RidA (YjgF/YER057c/UK114 family)